MILGNKRANFKFDDGCDNVVLLMCNEAITTSIDQYIITITRSIVNGSFLTPKCTNLI